MITIARYAYFLFIFLSYQILPKRDSKNPRFAFFQKFATGLGLEPRLTEPEPVVLPLDDPVKHRKYWVEAQKRIHALYHKTRFLHQVKIA